ncbi:Uma2 family endonuclease [Effusibacillus consociatus]|uniref:Uma2 family endonuclease n=1 Tax=Effusibacillus consociatus TaxID=1117041 RepID=A0ABV9Q439_9BACL
MSFPIERHARKYTYKDYLTWSDDERWELINGMPYNMTPAPSTKHQDVLGELFTEFRVYLRDKSCRVFVAPFDVRLFAENDNDENVYNVVQPDITVVCEKSKIDDKGCKGSPDLIVEVLSPATAKKDKNEKRKLYQQAKVKEYWIVDPLNETVEVFMLKEDGKFHDSETYSKEDQLKVGIFEDLTIDLKLIFKEG